MAEQKGLSSEAEIKAALEELPGWKQLADRADHHPDILIQYSKVTVTLWSHDKGGVTDRDLRLARQIEAAAKDQLA